MANQITSIFFLGGTIVTTEKQNDVLLFLLVISTTDTTSIGSTTPKSLLKQVKINWAVGYIEFIDGYDGINWCRTWR